MYAYDLSCVDDDPQLLVDLSSIFTFVFMIVSVLHILAPCMITYIRPYIQLYTYIIVQKSRQIRNRFLHTLLIFNYDLMKNENYIFQDILYSECTGT